jgi:hypothetical protein
MVGFREVHHDGLLTYLLRVRDPLNFAPIDELERWTRLRGLPAPTARALPPAATPAALPPASPPRSPLPLGLAEPAGTREPTEPSPPA